MTRLRFPVPIKSVLIPFAPVILSVSDFRLTLPVLELVSKLNETLDTAFCTSVILAAFVPTLPPLDTFVIC